MPLSYNHLPKEPAPPTPLLPEGLRLLPLPRLFLPILCVFVYCKNCDRAGGVPPSSKLASINVHRSLIAARDAAAKRKTSRTSHTEHLIQTSYQHQHHAQLQQQEHHVLAVPQPPQTSSFSNSSSPIVHSSHAHSPPPASRDYAFRRHAF
jgi:hypothetical protein